jgi:hypothetical protein
MQSPDTLTQDCCHALESFLPTSRASAKRTHFSFQEHTCRLCKYSQRQRRNRTHFHARRDKFTIHSKAVVCQDVELKGDITIGAGARIPLHGGNVSYNTVFQVQ